MTLAERLREIATALELDVMYLHERGYELCS
jgi:hypothetical protein